MAQAEVEEIADGSNPEPDAAAVDLEGRDGSGFARVHPHTIVGWSSRARTL